MNMTENETLKSALEKVKAQKVNFGFMERFDVDENWEVMKALEEIPRYRDLGTIDELAEMQVQYYHLLHQVKEFEKIGTVKEIRIREAQFKRLSEGYLNDLTLLHEYQSIGTIEEFKALREKSVAKVIELPCELNDTVFCILERRTRCTENDQEFDEYACQGCECLECDSVKEKYISEQKVYTLEWIVSNRRKFGKTIFLTKEEAEKKLTNKT